jgi:hypothetical protein
MTRMDEKFNSGSNDVYMHSFERDLESKIFASIPNLYVTLQLSCVEVFHFRF